MQTSTSAKRRARGPRAPAIPFPELPSHTDLNQARYWRAAWIRSMAMAEAMHRFVLRRSFSQLPDALRLAAITSERLLQEEAKKDLQFLRDAGGLLFAWIPEGGAA